MEEVRRYAHLLKMFEDFASLGKKNFSRRDRNSKNIDLGNGVTLHFRKIKETFKWGLCIGTIILEDVKRKRNKK
jgi:hypothetical protein